MNERNNSPVQVCSYYLIFFYFFLGKAVLLFLNENWKQVTEDLGRPVVDELIDIVYKIVKKFFEFVPKNELFVD